MTEMENSSDIFMIKAREALLDAKGLISQGRGDLALTSLKDVRNYLTMFLERHPDDKSVLADMDGIIRLQNHLKGRLSQNQKSELSQYPLAVTVEIMTVCNLKCSHCYQASTYFDDFKGLMDYDLFNKIVERLSPVIKEVNHFNFASVEALMHKRVFDMIRLVKTINEKISIPIYTNGMLLDERRIAGLLDVGTNNIIVSLDGCTRETVESFKTGTDFEKVTCNLKKLADICGDRVLIETNFVAHKYNIHEMIDYVDFCISLGVRKIRVSGLLAYTIDQFQKVLYSETGNKEVDDIFNIACQKASEAGINFVLRRTRLEPGYCFSSNVMYVDISGNMVPCVLLARKTSLCLMGRAGFTEPVIWGNVMDDDPCHIWMSKDYVEFRRLFMEKRLPERCSLCALGYGVIC